MKRNEALVPLSHDHHQGLIIAQLMSKNAPVYSTLPNTPGERRTYVVEKFRSELKPHFENEENLLFPFVKGFSSKLDLLIEDILEEHVVLEGNFERLAIAEDFIDLMHETGVLLNNHIRTEERELFELIQNFVPEEILAKLNGTIPAAGGRCDIRLQV